MALRDQRHSSANPPSGSHSGHHGHSHAALSVYHHKSAGHGRDLRRRADSGSDGRVRAAIRARQPKVLGILRKE